MLLSLSVVQGKGLLYWLFSRRTALKRTNLIKQTLFSRFESRENRLFPRGEVIEQLEYQGTMPWSTLPFGKYTVLLAKPAWPRFAVTKP